MKTNKHLTLRLVKGNGTVQAEILSGSFAIPPQPPARTSPTWVVKICYSG